MVALLALLRRVADAQAPSPIEPGNPPPPPFPPPTPPPPPNPPPLVGTCVGSERGWLTQGVDLGFHPVGMFGPLGIHGTHALKPLAGVSVVIDWIPIAPSPPVKAEDQTPLALRQVHENIYYPGREYRVKLVCPATCAFLLTVEEGAATGKQDAYLQQRGSFDLSRGDPRVVTFRHVDQRPYIAAISNPDFLAKEYSIYWRADSNLTYADYQVRVTAVVDNTTTCLGGYYTLPVHSEVVCGDGFKDNIEACDDGNLIDGDGCSSTCKIELGWTCAELVKQNVTGYRMSKCTKAVVVVSKSQILVTEGKPFQFDISLSTFLVPGTQAFVALAPFHPEISAISSTAYQFNPEGENMWNKPRPITMQISPNSIVDGQRRHNLTFSVSSTDPNFQGVESPNVEIIVLDDDGVGVVSSTKNITVQENGGGTFYELTLTSEPKQLVAIEIKASGGAQIAFTPTIPFDFQNWNVPQRVFVQAVDDDVAEPTKEIVLSHTISSNDPEYASLDIGHLNVTVTVVDNDDVGLEVVPGSIVATEGEACTLYTVKLQSKPNFDVNISLVVSDDELVNATGVTADEALNGKPYIVLTDVSWSQPYTVCVQAVDNYVSDGRRIATVTHIITSEDERYNNLNATSPMYPYPVTVVLQDNDNAGIKHADTVVVTEGSSDGILALSLLSEPTAPVTVTGTLADTSVLFADLLEVSWQPSEWREVREMKMSVKEDDNVDSGARTSTMSLTSRSNDPLYNDILKRNVTVTIREDDTARVVFDLTGFEASTVVVNEGDSKGARIPVYLNSKPNFNATVTVTASTNRQVSVTPDSFSFTTDTWSSPQFMKVVGTEDSNVEAEHEGILSFQVASSDPEYAALVLSDVRVQVLDNDRTLVQTTLDQWGGIVAPTIPYGGFVLTVPPGVIAVNQTAGFQISAIEQPLPAGVAGPGPEGTSTLRISGMYDVKVIRGAITGPVMISISYDEVAATTGTTGQRAGDVINFYTKPSGDNATVWRELANPKFLNGLAIAEVQEFSVFYVGTGPPPITPAPSPPPPPPPVSCPKVTTYENELYGVAAAAAVLLITLVVQNIVLCVQRARVRAMAPEEEEEEDDLLALPPPEADPASLQGPYDGAIAILEFPGGDRSLHGIGGAISAKDVALQKGKELV